MKHIADRGYTDIVLNKHIEKDAVLEEEYEKEGKELTKERIKYLVEERKLYKVVEETQEGAESEVGPEAEETAENIVKEDNNTEETRATVEEIEETQKEAESEVEETRNNKNTTKGGTKGNNKNTIKSE